MPAWGLAKTWGLSLCVPLFLSLVTEFKCWLYGFYSHETFSTTFTSVSSVLSGFFSCNICVARALAHIALKSCSNSHSTFWKLKPSAMPELKYRALRCTRDHSNQLPEAVSLVTRACGVRAVFSTTYLYRPMAVTLLLVSSSHCICKNLK